MNDATTPRSLQIITLAIELAHAAINYSMPGECMNLGMGGWQTYQDDFGPTTDAEDALLQNTFKATMKVFTPHADGIRLPFETATAALGALG